MLYLFSWLSTFKMGGQNSHNTQNTKPVTISTLFHNLNNKESKQERNTYFPSINKILPNELLKKILGYLDYKSLCNALQTCRHWKEIIDEFNFVKEASSKLFFILLEKIQLVKLVYIFRKNVLHYYSWRFQTWFSCWTLNRTTGNQTITKFAKIHNLVFPSNAQQWNHSSMWRQKKF